MATVVLDDEPVVDAWLEQRRALGQDGRDEVWEGDYHVAPHEHARNGNIAGQVQGLLLVPVRQAGLHVGGSFNLGEPGDFRVPDLGYHRTRDFHAYMPTAAIVIEVLSPRDETWAKSGFYAAHDVDELWVVDPDAHTIRMWALTDGAYAETGRSDLLGLDGAALAADVDWPA